MAEETSCKTGDQLLNWLCSSDNIPVCAQCQCVLSLCFLTSVKRHLQCKQAFPGPNTTSSVAKPECQYDTINVDFSTCAPFGYNCKNLQKLQTIRDGNGSNRLID